MNKWLTLIATLMISLVFFSTIRTTITFPTTSNVLISTALGIVMVIGFFLYLRGDKKKKKASIIGDEELTPC